MEFRLAHPNEVDTIMMMIDQAREHIASYGSDQWQNGYPTQEIIMEDILEGYGYVAVIEGQLAAYVAMIKGFEPAYDAIYDGAWTHPENHDYITFHRVMVHQDFRGQQVVQTLLEGLIETRQSNEFRADTHPKNMAMQHILKKLGFEQCGKVTFEGERLAYQKLK